MLHIAKDAGQLNTSSENVSGKIGSAQEDIADVSATMEQMGMAMQQTHASMLTITESVEDAFQAIQNIAEASKEGNRQSEDVKKRAVSIHDDAVNEQKKAETMAVAAAENMHRKIEQSKAVEEINDLTANILNISSQTNLLALNANIETARAGEAGRGFAVVVDEIGKLASDSAEAAAQIQKVSNEVLQSVTELAEEAEKLITFMNEYSGQGYEKLLDVSENYGNDVSGMNQLMQEFEERSSQLKENMDRIHVAVMAVNTAVEETAIGATNVAEEASRLTNLLLEIDGEADSNRRISEGLNEEMHKFKLE